LCSWAPHTPPFFFFFRQVTEPFWKIREKNFLSCNPPLLVFPPTFFREILFPPFDSSQALPPFLLATINTLPPIRTSGISVLPSCTHFPTHALLSRCDYTPPTFFLSFPPLLTSAPPRTNNPPHAVLSPLFSFDLRFSRLFHLLPLSKENWYFPSRLHGVQHSFPHILPEGSTSFFSKLWHFPPVQQIGFFCIFQPPTPFFHLPPRLP